MLSTPTGHGPEPSHSQYLQPILAVIASSMFLACAQGAHAQVTGIEEDLQKQIHTYEAVTQRTDPPAMAPLVAGRVWAHLGQLYEDAGRYPASENAFAHAIRLIRTVPGADADLACAIDGLGALYMIWGDLDQSERSLEQALSIRQARGMSSDLELSWFHLAALTLRERRFEKARDYAQSALDQIHAEPGLHAVQEVNARFALGIALCGLRRYPEAIAMMQAAMDEVHRAYPPGDLSNCFGSYILGFAYWKSGDVERSRSLMKEGVQAIEKQLGWGHPVCRALVDEYGQYLRSTHRKEEARAVREELKEHGGSAGLRPGQESLNIEALF